MSVQDINDGVAAIQRGDLQLGGYLLRRALQDNSLTGVMRSSALVWLAETNPDKDFRMECYVQALQADPTNADTQQRLNALLSSPPPAPPPPPNNPGHASAPPPPPRDLPRAQAVHQPDQNPHPPAADNQVPQMWEFGVRGGQNGTGTGFLVVKDGLVATTRFVVGNATQVTLIMRDGHEFKAKVVRSYPEYDLTFIRTNINVKFIRDFTPSNNVAPGTTLVADDFTEHEARAERRNTAEILTTGWFPTTFSDTLPGTFTGSPLLDPRDDVVGMLTRNSARNNGYLYGLHISIIRQKIESYYAEVQADPNRIYCGTCGNLSKAGAESMYYCETCGAMFPFAVKLHRSPHPNSHLYYGEKE